MVLHSVPVFQQIVGEHEMTPLPSAKSMHKKKIILLKAKTFGKISMMLVPADELSLFEQEALLRLTTNAAHIRHCI